MHPNNLHQARYPVKELANCYPDLSLYTIRQPTGELSIDFAQANAVKALNAALLKYFYNIEHWDIPDGYLCPPIPGRSDYLHYINDLLQSNSLTSNKAKHTGLDIGTGANLIYPMLAKQLFDWKMVGTDIHDASLQWANQLIQANPKLRKYIKLRKQSNSQHIFKGIIQAHDKFDFCMCNPPFHRSAQDAQSGSLRKTKNLSRHRKKRERLDNSNFHGSEQKQNSQLNFSGQANELWCEGGEVGFIKQMLKESIEVKDHVIWFTCLVSKKESLVALKPLFAKSVVEEIKIIEMAQGQKLSRFIAWRFA